VDGGRVSDAESRPAGDKDVPAPEQLRVALLSFDFGESSVPLANALARHAEVCLLLPQAERDLFLGRLSEAVSFVPFAKPRLRQPYAQFRLMMRLRRKIRRFGPDVLHVQQGQLWFNLLVRMFLRYPLVVTVHDPVAHPGDRGGAKTPQVVMNRTFRVADELIVHANSLVPDLVSVSGVAPRHIHTIPHRVDPVISETPFDVDEEPTTVLFFGRVWRYKGLDVLIDAEPLIAARVPTLKIIIAGEGESFDRYYSRMQNPERFEVHNTFVDNELRARLFARASVIVLPYIQASQSGVVPIAYAFGKPVVATTVGGLPEAVEHGVTGFLVPPGEVDELAAAVTRLLVNETLRRRFGNAAKRRFESKLSPDALALRTLEVYRLAWKRRHAV
jgi:glycosyltransferase involved in cell wall biosynthesis